MEPLQVDNIADMAKEERKGFKYVRIKNPAGALAERAAEGKQRTLASWVTEAVIEKLEREGLWPPRAEEKKDA